MFKNPKLIFIFFIFSFNSQYPMKEEDSSRIEKIIRDADISFYQALKIGIEYEAFDKPELSDKCYLIPSDIEEVYDFFKEYIEEFENHEYCPKKCIGEEANENENMFVEATEKNYQRHNYLNRKYYNFYKENFICSRTKKTEIQMRYRVNQWADETEERAVYIIEDNKVDHSKCNKQACVNEIEPGSNQNLYCYFINKIDLLPKKCDFVLEHAKGVTSIGSFKENIFFKYIEKHDEDFLLFKFCDFETKYKSRMEEEINKNKSAERVEKKENIKIFFNGKNLKLALFNWKNIGFGSLGLALSAAIMRKKNYASFKKVFIPVIFGSACYAGAVGMKYMKLMKDLKKNNRNNEKKNLNELQP